jgi:hypothetical protein
MIPDYDYEPPKGLWKIWAALGIMWACQAIALIAVGAVLF